MGLNIETAGTPGPATATQATLILLLLALPIAGFALTALIGRRMGARAWLIAVPAIIVTRLVASNLAWQALMVGASTSGSRPAPSGSMPTSCSTT